MATTSHLRLEAYLKELGLGPIPTFQEADVLSNPIDLYHSYLAEHVESLVECDRDVVYNAIQPPHSTGDGDLDIVVPRLKLPGGKPKEHAIELIKKIKSHPLFTFPFPDGIHIRFFFSANFIPRIILPYINDRKATYGIDSSNGLQAGLGCGRKKVLVEFSSPNIAQDFTAAHLRSTILGAFVANMYEAMGWEVVRINYLGDWGQHLGLLALGWKKYATADVVDKQADLFRYIHELYAKMDDELRPEQEARKKAAQDALKPGHDPTVLEQHGLIAERDAAFQRMEDGEPDGIALWKKVRDISIDYYIKTYARLNITFNEFSGESKVGRDPEEVSVAEALLKSRNISEEQEDGAMSIDFDKHGANFGDKKSAIIVRRDGSTTYLLRDIATVLDRFGTHKFDKMLYIVGEQEAHFRQVFKAVELMGRADIAERLQHIPFAKTNRRASTLGTAQLLGDILDQREDFMHEVMSASPDDYPDGDNDAVAKAMGMSSLVVQELLSKKAKGNGPDLSLLALEGETGPDLLLCHRRLCSAITSIGVRLDTEDIAHVDYSSLEVSPWCDILRLMARYPGVIKSAFRTLDPTTIISYLFQIVEEVGGCLDEADEDESGGEGSGAGSKYVARAVMYQSVRQILENGMKLLGITPIGE